MARGVRGTLQERLNKVVERRAARLARYKKTDEDDAQKEQELRTQLVRERVTAEYEAELEAKIQEELKREQNGTVPEDASSAPNLDDRPHDTDDQGVFSHV
jgi:hypothetical protein